MPGDRAGDDPVLAAAPPTPSAAADGGWPRALPYVEALAGCLEAGLMVIDADDGVVFCSEWMASTLGLARAELSAMTGRHLLEHVASLVPQPPVAVRDRLLLAPDRRITCEEFEIAGPTRSVIRWVARHVSQPAPAVVVVCTDITAEVDLASTRERQAITDPLTGLLNRRGVEPQLLREMHLAARHGRPLSVLLLDIDHFKAVNDQHGHIVGDQVLRAVAGSITSTMRGGDLAARWGGEEFLVLLPQTELEQARRAGERLRAAVEALRAPGLPCITVSGGVARLEPADSVTELLDRADRNLYAAKAAGRNCTR